MADRSVLLDKVRLYFEGLVGTSLMPRSSITTTLSWSFPSRVSGSTAEPRSPTGGASNRPMLPMGCSVSPSATTWLWLS